MEVSGFQVWGFGFGILGCRVSGRLGFTVS